MTQPIQPIKSTKADWRPPDMFNETRITDDPDLSLKRYTARVKAAAWLLATTREFYKKAQH